MHLRRFKGAANPPSVAPVLGVGDFEAIRLLAVWSPAVVSFTPGEQRHPRRADALWRWLWEWTRVDYEELALASGLSVRRCDQLLPVLVAARVVFPDGARSADADELVTAYVEMRTPARTRGRIKGQRANSKGTGVAE